MTTTYFKEITDIDWTGFFPRGGHLATGKDLTKAPNAFDVDRLLKTPTRGWFTPAQIKAMRSTELRSTTGHVWIWFDPYNGKNLVATATTGTIPRKTTLKLIKLMREYHGLNRQTDHEQQKSKEWVASHPEHCQKYQHEYHKSPAGQISKERKLDNGKALRALGLGKKADMNSRSRKNANLQSAHEQHTLQQLLRSKLNA
ncbi:unnamed protein product [Jaminaea pallidilutea]